MEYKYYRELKHNYLVFEDKSGAGESRYQYKIVESGRIKGLVPCTERNINGERYFYYEINSMQTIKDRFSSVGMNATQLKQLLSGIKNVLEGLSEFLLGEEGVVFNAKSIYTDLISGEFKFIYCPFYDEQKSFSELAMELLELVDEKDEEATELVYKLCEHSATLGDFIYETLENTLSEEVGAVEEKLEPVRIFEELSESEPYEDYEEEEDNTRMKRANRKLGGKLQLLFSLMFACVVGAMVYIRMNYVLSSEENMLSVFVMIVSAITGVIALVGGLKEFRNPDESYNDSPGQREVYEETGAFDDADDYVDDCDYESECFYKTPIRVSGSFTRDIVQKDMVDCGETVVLDEVKEGGLALFSRNLDKTVRIALDSLPITIGKMEGCVDKVLSDTSISRIHCRIVNDGGRIAILDLGSTNGSYRNGLKLNPQEKTYIEEGDEIRLGRVCFDCR